MAVLLQLIVVLLIAYLISPYLRINLNKTAYHIEVAPATKLEGNLAPNDKLKNAVYIAKGKVLGPETIIFINNTLYTGLANGQLVKLDEDGNVSDVIVQSGEENCKNINIYKTSKKCGVILGMRYKATDEIYFIDAHNGIFKVNIFTKKKTLILSADETYDGKRLTNLNDLDIDDEGNIYFSQASSEHIPEECLDIAFEGAPFGRLFHYNEKTKNLKLLLNGIAFANGVQLTPDKDVVIVSEISRFRLLKYYLKGSKKETSEVFLNLPGSSDNLRLTDHGTLLVPLVSPRSSDWISTTIIDFIVRCRIIRAIMHKVLNIPILVLHMPNYALVVEYDLNGNPLKSWHDSTGLTIDSASTAVLHDGKLYLGSFHKDYIGIAEY